MDLPQVIILSTQRSGTHLLESFLKHHPNLHGRGEMFLRYSREGFAGENVREKINVAILMYNQLKIFKNVGGELAACKIIHLLRDPKNVALSRCQARSDKAYYGDKYRAHLSVGEMSLEKRIKSDLRIPPDLHDFEQQAIKILQEQKCISELLFAIPHLELHYEDFVSGEVSIDVLNVKTATMLGDYLSLDAAYFQKKTSYVKTGIIKPHV
ncbi:MAG: sulfotransferase domain-containing protein [Mucilaginibacter sp.]|uniref:sulfotransferase domain-containing protein n=1 Tax=Mucilaginibacter sp. TaxID=1882438 RepID=UPI00326520AA